MQSIGVRRAIVGLMAGAVLSAAGPAVVQAKVPASCGTWVPKAGPTSALEIRTAKGPVKFQVELADTEDARAQGLMCRRAMAPDHGMLFDFKSPKPVYFWMKNTILPLDMVFIAGDGRIVAIAANTTPYSEDPVGPGAPVQAVLELGAGRAAAFGLAPGDLVRHRIFKTR